MLLGAVVLAGYWAMAPGIGSARRQSADAPGPVRSKGREIPTAEDRRETKAASVDAHGLSGNIRNEVEARRPGTPATPGSTGRADADPELKAFLEAKQKSQQADGLEAQVQPWFKYLDAYNRTGKRAREAHGHVRLIFLAQGWTNAEQKLKDAYILPMRDGQGAAFPGIKTLDDVSRLIAANPAVEDQVYLRLIEAELAIKDLNQRGYTRELEAQCRNALGKAKEGCSVLTDRYALRDYVRQAFAVYNSTFATFLEMRLRAWVALKHDDFNAIDFGLLKTQLELLGTMIKTIDEMKTSLQDEEWERFKRPFLEGMIEIHQSMELICQRGPF
ncbi:MAG: hypothetical protein M5U26_12575 [Planctomycetota bacterium]|nr:hypothetical protein [Planctomycetota bacterium]